MRVQEAGHLGCRDVFATFEEAAGEDGNGVGVRLHELGEDLGEADLVVQTTNCALLPGKQGREGVLVVVVDLVDVGIRDYDVGEAAQRLDPVRQPDRQQREGEARRREEGFG